MICPKCGDEYRDGFTVCAECRVALVDPAAEPESEAPVARVSGRPFEVLAEHVVPVGWVPIDTGGLELLRLEAELTAQDVDVMFEPMRPDDTGGFTRSVAQVFRLLVAADDLERAWEIATDIDIDPGMLRPRPDPRTF